MSTTMTDEIKAAITKNLSSEVGELLRQRLTEADNLEVVNKELLSTAAATSKDKATLYREVLELRSLQQSYADLAVRQETLKSRERNIEVAELKFKCEMLEKYGSQAWLFLQTLARNPTVKTVVTENIQNDWSLNSSGGGAALAPRSVNRTTEESTE